MLQSAEEKRSRNAGARSPRLSRQQLAASSPSARSLPAPVSSIGSAIAAAEAQPLPSALHLLRHRPVALLSLVPWELAMFIAGGVAGAIAKTTTAPLDRVSAGWRLCLRTAGRSSGRVLAQVKILMQVSNVNTGAVQSAAATAAKGGFVAAFKAIAHTEGVLGFWRGNGPQASASCVLFARKCSPPRPRRCCACCLTAPASCTGVPERCNADGRALNPRA